MQTDKIPDSVPKTFDPIADKEAFVKIIGQSTIFKNLNPEELMFVSTHCRHLQLPEKQTLFKPGEPAQALYIVIDGAIEIFDKEDQIIAHLCQGDCFGELELFSRSPYTSKAVVQANTSLIGFPLPGENLKSLAEQRPVLAARLLKAFLIMLAARTRKAHSVLKENSPWVRELRRQVYSDKLTGLTNRTFLLEHLPEYMDKNLALIMLKPDNFKDINDNYGHDIGDKVLVYMGRELSQHLGSSGSVSRWEGNALAIYISYATKEMAEDLALRIKTFLEELSLEHILKGNSFRLKISLGIGLSQVHGKNAEELLNRIAALPLEGRRRGGSTMLWPEDCRETRT